MAEAFGIAAGVIAVLQITKSVLSVCNDYSATVRGAGELSAIQKEMENLLAVLQTLETFVVNVNTSDPARLQTLALLCRPQGLLKACLEEIQRLEEKLKSPDWMKRFGPKGQAFAQSLRWPLKEADTKKQLAIISRFREILQLALDVDQTTLALEIQNLSLSTYSTAIDTHKDVRSTYDVTLQTQKNIHELGKSTTEIHRDIHQVGQSTSEIQKTIQLEKISPWLSAPNPSTNHNRACHARQDDTGLWFLNGPFHYWTKEYPLMWLYGKAGCGKTVLSSTIITEVEQKCRSDTETVAVVYFYFDFNDIEKQNSNKMICSLVQQLHAQSRKECQQLRTLFSSCGNGGRQPNFYDLFEVMKSIIKTFGTIYIILDALDECLDREELLEKIEKIQNWQISNLHMLLTSRELKDIETALEPMINSHNKICIQNAVVNADIELYVNHRLQNDRRLKRWQNHSKAQEEIKTTLKERADGMFRWAVCQLDALQACLDLKTLRKVLASLPKTLDETYARILCDIPEDYSEHAIRILQWLAFSMRPMRICELAEVVAVQPNGDPWFEHDARFFDPRDILTICPGLVVEELVNENDLHIDGYYDDVECVSIDYVRENHSEDGEAASDEGSEKGSDEEADEAKNLKSSFEDGNQNDDGIRDEDGNQDVDDSQDEDGNQDVDGSQDEDSNKADDSSQDDDGEGISEQRNDEQEITVYPHPAVLEDSSVAIKESEAEGSSNSRLHSRNDSIIRLAHFSVKEYLISKRIRDQPASSYYAKEASKYAIQEVSAHRSIASHCLAYLLQFEEYGILQESRTNWWFKNIRGYPLSKYAATQWIGHVKRLGKDMGVIETLSLNLFLDSDEAYLKWKYMNGYHHGDDDELVSAAPLYWASIWGAVGLVQLLLRNEANVNAQGGEYHTALQAACYFENVEIVQLLLKNGADVNLQGGEYHTALQAACHNENFETVQLLLNNGADVNFQGGEYHTALQAVCRLENLKIVQLLLNNGADVNLQGGEYHTALQAVCSTSENFEIVQLLLDHGADVNLQGGEYHTVLQTACCFPFENFETVQLLLNNGADVNIQGGICHTALQAACSTSGKSETVQLLLNNGADVNLQGGERFHTALQAASFYGRFEIVQLLLNIGAEINLQGGRYHTALQAACCSFSENFEIVQLLLNNGADVNLQGGEQYHTALQAACSTFGNFETVQLLLNNGADVNIQGGEFDTALQAACFFEHFEIVQLLLNNGADVNIQGERYHTALQAACRFKNVEIVQLLLNNGADVNAQSGSYYTALHAASLFGHEVIVETLLRHKADVNISGDLKSGFHQGGQGTALHAASAIGKIAIVKLLLEHEADVNAVGIFAQKKVTALQLARQRGIRSLWEYIDERPPKEQYEEIVRLLQAASKIRPRIDQSQVAI